MPSKFQRRHYQAIADTLKIIWDSNDRTLFTPVEVSKMAEALAKVFTADNPRFKRDTFMRAIGIGS
jgi:hypothetical protein